MTEISPNARAEAVNAVLAALSDTTPKERKPPGPGDFDYIDPAAVIITGGHSELPAETTFAALPDWFQDRVRASIRTERLFSAVGDLTEGETKPKRKGYFYEKHQCRECGERYGFDEESPTRFVASNVCALPGGMPVYDVLLNIPSGVIVFANDLRPLVTVENDHSIESQLSQRRYIEEYARFGMATVFTGNSCPGIWQQKGQIAIANYITEADLAENDPEDLPPGPFKSEADRGTRLGSICTDLWWYCAMDRDLFLARCAEEGLDPKEFGIDEVKVTPGTYAFSVERVERDAAIEEFSLITRTDRIAPPLAQRDLSVARTADQSQAWTAVEKLFAYSFIGGGIGRALDHLLCTNGNGYDWDKGLLVATSRNEDAPYRVLDEDSPDTHRMFKLIPEFEFKFLDGQKLYPLSYGYFALGTIPREIDPWWLSLVMIFARSTFENPTIFRDEYGVEKQQKMMRQVLVMCLDLMEERGGFEWLGDYFDGWVNGSPMRPSALKRLVALGEAAQVDV